MANGGLTNGGNGENYRGHVSGEQEIWMFPVALMFHWDAARDMLKYRANRMASAATAATDRNGKGVKFPFESAYSGLDVTPQMCMICPEDARNDPNGDCSVCADVSKYADYVTGNVGYAGRLYVSATGDKRWLEGSDNGYPLVKGIAEYFVSRAVLNQTTNMYDIGGIL